MLVGKQRSRSCSLTLGLIFGSIAGYYGGMTDRLLNVVVMNAFLSFPGILIAIAFVAFLGPGIFNLIFALSIGSWVELCPAGARAGAGGTRARIRRSGPRAGRQRRAHYRAAHSAQHHPARAGAGGYRDGRCDFGRGHHELSGFGCAASDRVLGSNAGVSDARSHLFDSPHLVLFPAAAVMLAVLSFNLCRRRPARLHSIRARGSRPGFRVAGTRWKFTSGRPRLPLKSVAHL